MTFIYTALHRLGAFSILVFFLLDPLLASLTELLHLEGWAPSIWMICGPA